MHSATVVLCILSGVLCVLSGASFLTGQATWLPLTELGARTNHSLTYDVARDRLVLIGGQSGQARLGDVWEWDGATWHRRSDAPGVIGHGVAYDLFRRQIVHFGGSDGSPAPSDATSVWDGQTWTLLTPTTKPAARSEHAMAYDVARRVVVMFGGATGRTILDDTWEWDGRDWTRRATANKPPASAYHAMSHDIHRRVTVLFVRGQTWEWNGKTWTKRQPTRAPVLVDVQMTYDFARRETVLFGATTTTSPRNEIWTWDGTNWTQKTPAVNPASRQNTAIAYDSARRTVRMYGGISRTPLFTWTQSDLWDWDGKAWSLVDAPRPLLRKPVLAYDERRDRVVMFGGSNGRSPIDNTWEFDHDRWREVIPKIRPRQRVDHAMCDDGRTMLAFGGRTTSSWSNETWSWNGKTWSALKPTRSPLGRAAHAMAFDRTRNRVVLFGGNASGRHYADTWEWNPATRQWTLRQPKTSPAGRSHHAMAYDPKSKRIVLFGGSDGTTLLGDTWIWNGSDWRKLSPRTSPPARVGHRLVADTRNTRVLLYGSDVSTDTWSFDGADWRRERPSRSPRQQTFGMTYVTSRGHPLLFSTSLLTRETSTWIYDTAAPAGANRFGSGCSSVGATPRLAASTPRLGTKLWLDLTSDLARAPTLFALAPTRQSLSLGGGCTLYLKAPLVPLPASTNAFGFAALGLSLPANRRLRRAVAYAQALTLDAKAPVLGLSFSSGVRLQLGH